MCVYVYSYKFIDMVVNLRWRCEVVGRGDRVYLKYLLNYLEINITMTIVKENMLNIIWFINFYALRTS